MSTSPQPPRHPSRLGQFVAELKRRHVVRFALGYAAAAFVVLQLAEIIFPAFQIGETGLRILVVAVALLFPPAVVLAWIFDITAQGIERTTSSPDARRNRLMPRLALLCLTVVTVGAVGMWLDREGVFHQTPQPNRRRSSTAAEPTLVAYDAAQPIRSLAVLPLDDFSGEEGTDYFTLGMQEELIAQLSQLPGLRVVSRTSVQRYAGGETTIPRIGRDLQVDAVIEGSVRRSEDQVRITVQLIHAASDTHIWTQQYDRDLENLLALQSEVALDIARQIQAQLSPEETSVLERVASRSVAPEAQDAYLRGRFEAEKGTPEALTAAQDFFQAAVDEDSTFAPALAELAGTRFLLGLADSSITAEEMSRIRDDAERALAMDSSSMEAREVLTFVAQGMPQPPEPAATPATPRTRPVGRVSDSDASAAVDSAWFQAMTTLGRRIEVQVRSLRDNARQDAFVGRFVGARQLMAAGLFDQARDFLTDLVTEEPERDPAWELRTRAEIASGDADAALATVREWSRSGGPEAPDPASVTELQDGLSADGVSGYWAWMLRRLERRKADGGHVSPTELAAAHAGSGDTEAALAELTQALAEHDRGLVTLHKDPVWDVLRGDPRFTEIARQARSVHFMVRGRPQESGRR